MYSLSEEQMQNLVEVLIEEHGDHLERADFEEAMMNYFDDIPGFETMRATHRNSVINNLWRIYRDNE